jgi:hypothetical protein
LLATTAKRLKERKSLRQSWKPLTNFAAWNLAVVGKSLVGSSADCWRVDLTAVVAVDMR